LSRTVCFVHQGFVAHGQAQRGHQHLDGELDDTSLKSNCHAPFSWPNTCLATRGSALPGQQVALHEGVLDQAAQAVVLGGVGTAQRGTGAAGQFGHQVAAGDE
jgi:hypothetical protein